MGKPTRRSTRTTNSTKAPLPPPVKSAAVETVAILTPTHRFDVLDLCLDRIASQTILNRIEAWVLVDGSKHADAHVWSSVLGSLRRRCRQDSALKHLTIVDGSALVKPPRNIAAYRNATLEAAARGMAIVRAECVPARVALPAPPAMERRHTCAHQLSARSERITSLG